MEKFKENLSPVLRVVGFVLAALFLFVIAKTVNSIFGLIIFLGLIGFAIYYGLRGRKNATNYISKISNKALLIVTLILFVVSTGALTVHSNQVELKESRIELENSNDQLSNLSLDYVSKATQRKVKDEQKDTREINKSKNNASIKAETKRLNRLISIAKSEQKVVNKILSQSAELKNDENILLEDKADIDKLEKKANNYQSLSSYKKESENLLALISVHNQREEQLKAVATTLKDKNLSTQDKSKLDKLVLEIKIARKASDIKDKISEINTALETAKSNIQIKKEVDDQKEKLSSTIKSAQSLLNDSYISSSDKVLIQDSLDLVNKAQTLDDLDKAAQNLIENTSKVQINNESAKEMADKKKRDDEQKRIAEEKAATQAAASQEKESAQSNSEVSGGNYSTNTSGWGVAQSGYCFYRSNSKKYYSSVANPGNYTYMTISEAQGLGGTPGHSNGSAHT
ncbi:hypothetical protein EFL99_01570 [Lactococcus lactis]|uniref:hypothetical protein n=1 Tax=Lactococcus lactis TaxID=1358 RepID=UPI001F530E60|nr:hypothetical protein [Lactococcus lactis]MCI1071702.1 hypothetical protein [Lactococcus lactis]MCT1181992.1 hypothetical protein [Lactococcus lactis]MCT1194948.1 hypothetical protein [Lactococcus lactis]